MQRTHLALFALVATAKGFAGTCSDKIFSNSSILGSDATAILNVSDAAECCARCHEDFHDECAAWTFGATASSKLYDQHNCAIMATLLERTTSVDHLSGIVASPAPPPAPLWPQTGADHSKCSAGVETGAADQRACQDKAVAAGHRVYSYSAAQRRCKTTATCTLLGNTSWDWRTFASPAPAPPASHPCRADVDCKVDGTVFWRCSKSRAPPSPENNCSLAGKVNATCACGEQGCGRTPDSPKNATSVQYLMIGDSISLGMRGGLSSRLAPHGWELTHNPGNADSANLGAHCLADWLQSSTRRWDVISFNFGLHDIAYTHERVTAEQYRRLLSNITAALVAEQRRSGTQLLWVTTTPVPNKPVYDYNGSCIDWAACVHPPRFDADVLLYNGIAADVMVAARQAGASIATLDLYSYVVQQCGGPGYSSCPGFQLDYNVHFTARGWSDMAQQMAEALLELRSYAALSV